MSNHRIGLTLVELSVVLAIVGVLISLLLPAVQYARESARRASCVNNVKQLATASLLHVDSHGYFPSGGWSGTYTADPNRGYGENQPGGWAYGVLSYLGEQALRSLGTGESLESDLLGPGLRALHVSAPPPFYCPSRRAALPYPVGTGSSSWRLSVARGVLNLSSVTKCDYAANSGDSLHHAADSVGGRMWWPSSYEDLASNPTHWTNTNDPTSIYYQTGISFYRSQVKPSAVTDGMSSTYLIGEKFLSPIGYEDINAVEVGGRYGDNQSAWAGYEWDNHRVSWRPGSLRGPEAYQPRQDTVEPLEANIWAFGSAHATSFNMAFCDGSVRPVSYDVNLFVHREGANREDGGSL